MQFIRTKARSNQRTKRKVGWIKKDTTDINIPDDLNHATLEDISSSRRPGKEKLVPKKGFWTNIWWVNLKWDPTNEMTRYIHTMILKIYFCIGKIIKCRYW